MSEPRFNVNSHFNASQLRMDTWNKLKYSCQRLIEHHSRKKSTASFEREVQRCFKVLEPIERYWAFPGQLALERLEDLFTRKSYELFGNVVHYIVRSLANDAYRNQPSTLNQLESGDISATLHFSRLYDQGPDPKTRHYFEVLVVDDISQADAQALRKRMRNIHSPDDVFVYDLLFAPSFEDALIAVLFNHNIQACVIRYDFPYASSNTLDTLRYLLEHLSGIIDPDVNSGQDLGALLGQTIKELRPELDLYLVLDSGVEDTASKVYQNFRRVFYRQEDYHELHLSIKRGISERYETPFFAALKAYSQRPTGVFHAMPISRGNSIFKSHWIQDMGDFYGRNIFLAETSATTGGLDSLLQPIGPLKRAQARAAKAFGAQQTFFVTNGTSTANKIVLQALVQPGDIVLVDRDCHKSHHYGLMLSGAYPIYLDSYPIREYSMYGAVPLQEIKRVLLELKHAGQLARVRMLLLTNCTFDGIVYNPARVMEEVLAIKPDMIFLWDEAWFAFAGFSPLYRQRTAMASAQRLYRRYQSSEYRQRYQQYLAAQRERARSLDNLDDGFEAALHADSPLLPDPDKVKVRVYATHSTHKKLSSLRQGSMIHIWDEEYQRKVEDSFHEAYMTHTSTSANYQILASLDVARRQAELEGFELVQKSAEAAMTLRAKIADHPLLQRYLRMLTIKDLIPEDYRQSGLEHYYDAELGWSRMEVAWRDDEFVLDPTHISVFTGGAGIDGDTFKNRYLMDQFGIQVNKTSRNTVLFMTNIGTTRSSVAYLISVLLNIAEQLEAQNKSFSPLEHSHLRKRIHSLSHDLPPLPDFSAFHQRFRPNPHSPEGDIRSAYFMAYDELLWEYLTLEGHGRGRDKSIEQALVSGREVVSAAFIIPYPPGFPILVPGQVISPEILDFMKALDVSEIHGYRPELGLRVFTEAALRAPQLTSNLHHTRAYAETAAAKPDGEAVLSVPMSTEENA